MEEDPDILETRERELWVEVSSTYMSEAACRGSDRRLYGGLATGVRSSEGQDSLLWHDSFVCHVSVSS